VLSNAGLKFSKRSRKVRPEPVRSIVISTNALDGCGRLGTSGRR
jgi:hypothetical protein